MAVHRRRAAALLLLALLAASCMFGAVRAQEEEEVADEYEDEEVEEVAAAAAAAPRAQPSHPLTNMAPPAPGVETTFVFTKHQGDLPIGEEIAILCAFSNKGSSALNITHVMGSINSPYNFGIYVANFSARAVNADVQPGDEVAIVYGIMANPLVVDPFEYRLAFTAFYNDGQRGYTTTFFNETRQFYETSQPWDFKAAFPYLVGIAAVGGIFVYVNSHNNKNNSKFDVDDDEWDTTGVGAATKPKSKKEKGSKKGSKKQQ